MDIRDLKFENESFDVLIDKGGIFGLSFPLKTLKLGF